MISAIRALSLSVAATAVLSASPLAAQDEAGLRVGAPAPVVSVDDLDGKPISLGEWIGKKPVLLEFWATWCTNCEALLPRLMKAREAAGNRVEFVAVNVTVNQTPERVRKYVQEHDVPFRILYDDKGTATRAYLAPATSYVVIVDSSGRVAYTGLGADQRFEGALNRAAGLAD